MGEPSGVYRSGVGDADGVGVVTGDAEGVASGTMDCVWLLPPQALTPAPSAMVAATSAMREINAPP
jgi:hypothetical protein